MRGSILNAGHLFLLVVFFCSWKNPGLNIKNGWITCNNRVIIGNSQRTDYWEGYKECQGDPEWENIKEQSCNYPGK